MSAIQRLKLRLRFGFWARLRANRFPSFHLSHSQFGEDMVARVHLEHIQHGTYVDVGAHHPVYFSNTYHFYCRGWRGLNVDARPGTKELFDLLRPRDITIEACLAGVRGRTVEYFEFNEPALNTTDPATARLHEARAGVKLLGRRAMSTVTLPMLLEKHLSGTRVDLLSIDVEGMDQEILESNDWDRWRPRVLVFERHGLELEQACSDPLLARLREIGYRVRGKCGPSWILSTDSEERST